MDKKAGLTDVSARIQGILDYFKINQTELAAALEITPGYVSSMLAGTKTPSNKLIHKIKNRYEVLDRWWETGEGQISAFEPDEVNPELGQSKMQREFVEKYVSPELMMVFDTFQKKMENVDPKIRYAAVILLSKYINTDLIKDSLDSLGEQEED